MSDSTALANIQAVTEMWNSDQVKLIRDTIAPGISPSELGLFAMVCQRTGLDPFTKQIYAISRKARGADGEWTKRMTIQTGIDGYRLLAVRSGELAGIDDAVYDTDDADHPGRASVTVWRLVQGHRVAFTATARWAEYVQDNSPMWKRMPYLMLGKCAESLALRKAFPAELSGIYTAEEMAQADNNDTLGIAPTHRVIEAEPTVAPVPAEMAQAAPAAAKSGPATDEQREMMRRQRNMLKILDKSIEKADNLLNFQQAQDRIKAYDTHISDRQLQQKAATR